MPPFVHQTVLLRELVEALNLNPGDQALDCTAGGGGHTAELLKKVGETGVIHAFDRDINAINNLKTRFSAELLGSRLELYHSAFSEIDKVKAHTSLQGIAADLGVSSPQIDEAERGFSFHHDGPLDMRMSPESGQASAADVIATYSESELCNIFKTYGEEPKAYYAAQAIVKARDSSPILRTSELASIISKAIFYKEKSRKHPATKIFQALRIYVNNELGEVQTMLEKAFSLLSPGGRLAIISFHSLEDRLIKNFFKEKAGKNQNSKIPKNLPLTASELNKLSNIQAKIIKPFPINPSKNEVDENPRSRSAKLRVLEKLA